MKLCKDCQHFRKYYIQPNCVAPQLPQDALSGHRGLRARNCRTETELCGMTGKWFEPKPPPWWRTWFEYSALGRGWHARKKKH